jgi:hypothetical protein
MLVIVDRWLRPSRKWGESNRGGEKQRSERHHRIIHSTNLLALRVYRRQPLPYRIAEGLPVTRVQSSKCFRAFPTTPASHFHKCGFLGRNTDWRWTRLFPIGNNPPVRRQSPHLVVCALRTLRLAISPTSVRGTEAPLLLLKKGPGVDKVILQAPLTTNLGNRSSSRQWRSPRTSR